MLALFGCVSLGFVTEGAGVVKVVGFESVLCKANVGLNFFRSFVCHCGLVDYCLCLAFSLQ